MSRLRDRLRRALGGSLPVADSIPSNPNALTEGVTPAIGNMSSFVNYVTGMGTSADASFWDTWTAKRSLTDDQRWWMGRNALIRNSVLELQPNEATREGWSVEIRDDVAEDPEAITQGVTQYEARPSISMQERCAEAWARADQYGESLILLGIDDGNEEIDFSQPVQIDKIESIRWARVIDRRHFTYNKLAGINESNFGEPLLYEVNDLNGILPEGIRRGDSGSNDAITAALDGKTTATFHHTRVIRFTAPDGISVLDSIQDSMAAYFTGTNGLTASLREHSVGIWRVKNWMDTALSTWMEHARSFLQRAQRSKSTINALVVDDEREDFQYLTRNVSGVGDLINPIMVWAAAARRVPVTVFWGVSPGGFGTGESERATFQESIRAAQVRRLGPPLMKWHDLVFQAKDGPTNGQMIKRADRKLVFHDLEPPDEQAQQELADAQISNLVSLVQAGVITEEEAAMSLPQTVDYSIKLDEELRRARKAQGDKPKSEPMPVGIFTALLGEQGLIAGVKSGLVEPSQARELMRVADPDRFASNDDALFALFPDGETTPPASIEPGPANPDASNAEEPQAVDAPDLEEEDEPDEVEVAFSQDPLPSDCGSAREIARELSEQTGHRIPTGRITRLAREGRVRSWSLLGGKPVMSRAEVKRVLAEANGLVQQRDRIRKDGDEWIVESESGEELGRFGAESEARERLRQIEAAKAAKSDDEEQ